jgi:hypothetical protein
MQAHICKSSVQLANPVSAPCRQGAVESPARPTSSRCRRPGSADGSWWRCALLGDRQPTRILPTDPATGRAPARGWLRRPRGRLRALARSARRPHPGHYDQRPAERLVERPSTGQNLTRLIGMPPQGHVMGKPASRSRKQPADGSTRIAGSNQTNQGRERLFVSREEAESSSRSIALIVCLEIV